MKKANRIITIALALLMSATLLSCNNGGSKTSSDTTTAAAPSEEVTTEAVAETDPPATEPETEAETEAPRTIYLVKYNNEWSYKVTTTPDFYQFLLDNPGWMNADFDDSSWAKEKTPYGDIQGSAVNEAVGWNGDNHGLFLRSTFTIEDMSAIEGRDIYLDIFYDNSVNVFINGTFVYTDDAHGTDEFNDWTGDYVTVPFDTDVMSLLKEGENTIAVCLLDGWGGREIDLAVIAGKSGTMPTNETRLGTKPWYTEEELKEKLG